MQARDAKLLAETMAIFQQERSPRGRKREREVADADGDEEEREGRGGKGKSVMGPTNSEFARPTNSELARDKRCKGACDVSALLN